MNQTQDNRILEHLKKGQTITALEALELFGCFRLSAVIHRLRENYEIDTNFVTKRLYRSNDKKTFAEYVLIGEKK
mgnify:CR=1 FL=1|tara:strand:+ start:276 stop:500 length:225 start_codon:yes stop_codon:yes gene_type:complete